LLRRNILCSCRNENVLLASGNPQEAVMIQLAEISRAIPSVLDRLLGFLLFLEVADHHGRAASQNLTILSYSYFDSRERFPNRSEFEVFLSVHRNHRGSFGQPVAFKDQNTYPEEKFCQILVQRSPAGNEHSQTASQLLPQL